MLGSNTDDTQDMTERTLSPHAVRFYADNLSRFPADSVARQLTIHVQHGDFTSADATTIAAATDARRDAIHADALFHTIAECGTDALAAFLALPTVL